MLLGLLCLLFVAFFASLALFALLAFVGGLVALLVVGTSASFVFIDFDGFR